MSRYSRPTTDVPEWVPVSAEHPCLVCGASIACTFLANGDFACCVNVTCDRPVLNGGWLHRLNEPGAPTANPLDPEPLRSPALRPEDPAITSVEGRPA